MWFQENQPAEETQHCNIKICDTDIYLILKSFLFNTCSSSDDCAEFRLWNNGGVKRMRTRIENLIWLCTGNKKEYKIFQR